MYIIGGRDDKQIEIHPKFKDSARKQSHTLNQISELSSTMSPTSKWLGGRKHHVSLACDSGILVHGGETFDGRSREPVAEMFFIRTKPHVTWVQLGRCPPGRAGHVILVADNKVMIHGGQGQAGVIYGDLYQLQL